MHLYSAYLNMKKLLKAKDIQVILIKNLNSVWFYLLNDFRSEKMFHPSCHLAGLNPACSRSWSYVISLSCPCIVLSRNALKCTVLCPMVMTLNVTRVTLPPFLSPSVLSTLTQWENAKTEEMFPFYLKNFTRRCDFMPPSTSVSWIRLYF